MNKFGITIVLLILFCLLAVRFYFFYSERTSYPDQKKITFTARLLSVPKSDGRFQNFSLDLPNGPKLFISTSRFPEYYYGELLKVSGLLEKKIYEDRIIYTMSYPTIKTVKDANPFYGLVSFIRSRISKIYQESLPPVSASLLIGIVFGIKEQMPEEFSDSLRNVGVMHVIAASGMNVSMVAGAIFVIFSSFLHRRKAIVLSLLAIVFYAFLAGFEASIVRATLMAGIAFSASYLGRQYFGFLALIITAYLMLLFNPGYSSDVGFQLSFLSTLGILFVMPHNSSIKKVERAKGTKWYEGIKDDVSVTVAAQIATLPILLSVFGQYGLLSIPVNALVLWTIPVLMVLGSLAAIVGLVLPILAKPFLFLALPFLLYFETVVRWAGEIGFSFQVESFGWQLVLGYYLILVAIILSRQRHRHSEAKPTRLAEAMAKRENLKRSFARAQDDSIA